MATMNSPSSSSSDEIRWEHVETQFRRLMHAEDESLLALGEHYPRQITSAMSLAVDQLPWEAKSILLALAAFDDLPIPEVVVRLLMKCTDGHTTRFWLWRDFLHERGLINHVRKVVPWSRSPQSMLSLHGVRKECVKMIQRDEILRMFDNLLRRLPVRNRRTEEGFNSDAYLMAALFVVYGEGELAYRAAARLGVSDFRHMGNLILKWLPPFVSLLRVVDDHDKWEQHLRSTHIIARQVILEFICNGNPEAGIVRLLAQPECALTVSWATAVHALDRPVLIATESVVKSLLTLLEKNLQHNTQMTASWAVSNIMVCSEAKQFNLAKFPGFLECFVQLLGRAYDMDDDIQSIAAWALRVVAEAEENRLEVAAFPGALHGLVRLLGTRGRGSLSSNSDTQANAAWALANLTVSKENKTAVAAIPGALQGLVNLLGKDVHPSTQSKAAWALANLAELQEYKVKIALLPGVLKALVKILSVEDFYCNLKDLETTKAISSLNATWAVSSLSSASENKVRIAQYPGLLKALVRLLHKDVNLQIRCTAAWTIVQLAGAFENKAAIISVSGAVEGLANLMDTNEDNNYQQTTWQWRNLSAAWALGSLAEVEENKATIAACPGVFKGLVGLLTIRRTENSHIQSRAAWALAYISAASDSQAALAAFPGALQGLVGLLNEIISPHTQSHATRALAHIVETRQNRVIVAKFPGALESLVWLLGKDVSSSDTRNNAARALATMATVEENQVAIANFPSAVENLVSLLEKVESAAVQINAGWALANLAEKPRNRIKISSVPGAVERLLELLEEDVDVSLQAVAATTLTQIAAKTSNRLILRSAEAYRNRAMINIEMENYTQALDDLTRALKLQPDNLMTFSWRRFVRVMLKDYKGGLVDANRAISMQPENPFHWLERGVLKRMMGNFNGALADLDRALDMNPWDYESLKHRAYVKFLIHDQPGACVDAEKAIAAKPHSVDESGFGAGYLAGYGVEFLVYKLK